MRFFHIAAIRDYLRRFDRIQDIGRIDDTIIRIRFDKEHAVAFDLARGRSDIFGGANLRPLRTYRAPFDIALKKQFANAVLLGVETPGEDKVLLFEVEQQGAYRARRSRLRLEFTGRHTNAIILDTSNRIVEALRHVDESVSYRVIKPGRTLAPLPPYTGPRQTGQIDDIEAWLRQRAARRSETRLETLRRRHMNRLQKKIDRLEKALAELPDRTILEAESQRYNEYANLVLAHLHRIRPYDKTLKVENFEGTPVTIPLPPLPNPRRIGEHYFTLARRAANKAARLHIEKENLQSRLAFYRRMADNLRQATTEEQIRLLFPPDPPRRKTKEPKLQCELFEYEGWRIRVGRNERENAWLLRQARAGDLWLHLKERPSSHVIIENPNRRQIPRHIIEKAARLCVETSLTQPGAYLVDFTYRRHVKIERGAQVNYVNYDTIKVTKD